MTYPFLARLARRLALAGTVGCTLVAGCQDPPPYIPLPDDIVFDCPLDCEACTVPDECAAFGLTAPIAVGASFPLDPRILGIPADYIPADAELPEYVPRHETVALIGDAGVLTQQAKIDGSFVLRAEGAGISAVVFHDDAGRVLDVVHVRTAVADGLELDVVGASGRAPAPSPLELAVGEVVTLAVTPTVGERRLGGDATAMWSATSEPDAGEPIGLGVDPSAPAIVEVAGLAPGDSTLSASFASLGAELRVVVR